MPHRTYASCKAGRSNGETSTTTRDTSPRALSIFKPFWKGSCLNPIVRSLLMSAVVHSIFLSINLPRDLPSPRYQQRENCRDSCWCHAGRGFCFFLPWPPVRLCSTLSLQFRQPRAIESAHVWFLLPVQDQYPSDWRWCRTVGASVVRLAEVWL